MQTILAATAAAVLTLVPAIPGATALGPLDRGDTGPPATMTVLDASGADVRVEDAPVVDGLCDALPRVILSEGYHQVDGHDRPFWWEDDGLHFAEPIPAHGYVNINVPGACNLSIDINRDLIGAMFVPWARFGLTPGTCVTWTESNGYSYHFGEDNSGRGGADERGWAYCVPGGTTDPEVGPEEEVEAGPDPEVVDPEVVDPEVVDPEVVDPETGTTDPVGPGAGSGAGGGDCVEQDSAVLAADPDADGGVLAVTGAPAAPVAAAATLALLAGAVLVSSARRRTRPARV